MTSDPRKHPSAAFWFTVAMLAVLVGHPLSQGPVLFVWWNFFVLPEGLAGAIRFVYAPAQWVADNGPAVITGWYGPYLDWWARLGMTS